MDSMTTARRIVALLLVGGAVGAVAVHGQSTLPPMGVSGAAKAMRPATVRYAQGELEISADNSSLNQILYEISRVTGMKISGGVADQAVYGKYGPASPTAVLARLLEGSGCNMLLMESSSARPEELILTPRQGGATPPSPNATGPNADAAVNANQPAGAHLPPVNPGMVPPEILQKVPGAAELLQRANAPQPTDGTDTQPASSTQDGSQSPQDIYRQLKQMMSQQAQQQQQQTAQQAQQRQGNPQ